MAPQTTRFAVVDLNGQLRGKRAAGAFDPDKDTLKMPLSVLNLDIFGADIEDSPLVFETGDRDGMLRPSSRGAVPMPWLATPSMLVPMVMHTEDGAPFEGDPRHALEAVLGRYAADGLQVMAATELEFTLFNADGGPVLNPQTGNPIKTVNTLSLQELDAFDQVFTDLYEACEAMGIPAKDAISEAAPGQFEVTLTHQDALKAADDTMLFKHMVKGLARKWGMRASFMAKPDPDQAGNGMHVHVSVLRAGRNIFDDGGPNGTDALRHAVAGCLRAMRGATLLFAPHANSYARLTPGAHAPTGIGWSYENRTVALRIPNGPSVARRFEHRVAGGDINPYLLLTAILGAAHIGLVKKLKAPAPVTGNAYAQKLPQLAEDWASAIDLFATDPLVGQLFPPLLIDMLTRTKRQELAKFSEMSPPDIRTVLLDRV
ncbi:glutamine synthetase family protein [Cognatishimia sp. MH4019]|uniref:glutamine synthetase family protein n=1 Tax=Cognatishimia sp. MH4019 TaxID=2854030 RepID=UPI001CD50909|nr:glutamine synthetase family protein [Cognatishimia sp. MH4019]